MALQKLKAVVWRHNCDGGCIRPSSGRLQSINSLSRTSHHLGAPASKVWRLPCHGRGQFHEPFRWSFVIRLQRFQGLGCSAKRPREAIYLKQPAREDLSFLFESCHGRCRTRLWRATGRKALQFDLGAGAAAGCAAACGARPTTTVRRPCPHSRLVACLASSSVTASMMALRLSI